MNHIKEAVMKKILLIMWASLIWFALFTSAGSAADDMKYSGFIGDFSRLMRPGIEGGVKMRWVKPYHDFSKYNKIMLDSVVFFFAEDSEYKGINTPDLKELTDGFDKALVDALIDKYPIVSEPGPDVVRIRFAITDLKQSKPVLSAVTSVVPSGVAISLVKRGVTGSWVGSGGTSMEAMFLDSVTNEVLGLIADNRMAAFTDRFTKWGSAQEAFRFWAGRLRNYADLMKTARVGEDQKPIFK
jgi:hypothetical protein